MIVTQILGPLIDRPGVAFERIRKRPHSWWFPALLLLLTMMVLVWHVVPFEALRQQEQMESILDRLPEAQREVIEQQGRPVVTTRRLLISGVLGGAVVTVGGWLMRAGVLHLSAVALGGESQWGSTFATVVWSMFPMAIRNILQVVFIWVNGRAIVHQGLSFLVASGDPLMDAANPAYHILAAIDPFVIWHLVLLAIGTSVALRISKTRAAIFTVILWLVLTAFPVMLALLSARLTAQLFR